MIDRIRASLINGIRGVGVSLPVFAGRVEAGQRMPYALINIESNGTETFSNGYIENMSVEITIYFDGTEPTASRCEKALRALDFASIKNVLHCLPRGVSLLPTPDTFRGKPLTTLRGRWDITVEQR